MERYSIVRHFENRMAAKECPILFETGNLLRDTLTGKMMLQAKFRNVSEKTVVAFLISVDCFDVKGELIGKLEEFQYLDLSAGSNQFFGYKTPIILPYDHTRSIAITAKEVVFENNELWKNKKKIPYSSIPSSKNMLDILGEKLYEQYVREFRKQGKMFLHGFVPVEEDGYWICSCGQFNLADDKACLNDFCKIEKDFIFSLADSNKLELLLEQYNNEQEEKRKKDIYLRAVNLQNNGMFSLAVETFDRVLGYKDADELAEKCRVEAEKRKLEDEKKRTEKEEKATALKKRVKKTLAIVLPSIAGIGIFGFLLIALIIPSVKYSKAKNLLEEKEYVLAENAFKDLDDFKDSADMVKESIYLNAEALFEIEKYDEARPIYKSLNDFKDSAEKEKECRYLLAEELFVQKKYERAALAFNQISGYKDSSERGKESRYLLAESLFRDKDYKEAERNYSLSGNYKDSEEKRNESNYLHASVLYSEKRYIDAETKYSNLGDYKDSKNKALESKYNYVINNKSRDNSLTMSYLEDLRAKDYKDSKSIYNSLTKWVAKIVVNSSTTDNTTNLSSISKHENIVFHVTITGGKPDEEIKIKQVTHFSDGDTHSSTTDFTLSNRDSYYSGWYDRYSYYGNPTGRLTRKFYNDKTGELLGTHSVNIY